MQSAGRRYNFKDGVDLSFNRASCAATKAVWGGRRHGGGQHCQHGDFHQLCRVALHKNGKHFACLLFV